MYARLLSLLLSPPQGWMKTYGVLTKGKLDLFDCLTQSVRDSIVHIACWGCTVLIACITGVPACFRTIPLQRPCPQPSHTVFHHMKHFARRPPRETSPSIFSLYLEQTFPLETTSWLQIIASCYDSLFLAIGTLQSITWLLCLVCWWHPQFHDCNHMTDCRVQSAEIFKFLHWYRWYILYISL